MIGATNSMVLCTLFVDGGYVQAALRQARITDDLDPRALGDWLRNMQIIIGNRQVIVDRTFYYDAVDPTADDSDTVARRTYLQTIESLPEVRVGNLGWLRRAARQPRRQVAVDVQLAVDAMELAFLRRDGAIAIVAGDGDFEPLLDRIRRVGPYAILMAFRTSIAQELADAADRVVWLDLPLPEGVNWYLTPAPSPTASA